MGRVDLWLAGLFETARGVAWKHSDGFRRWPLCRVPLVAMAVRIVCVAQALEAIPVGTAYAVLTGLGAAGVVTVAMWIPGESRAAARVVCILLIVTGVVGPRMTSTHWAVAYPPDTLPKVYS